jgi:hypothetical protein
MQEFFNSKFGDWQVMEKFMGVLFPHGQSNQSNKQTNQLTNQLTKYYYNNSMSVVNQI